MIRCAICGRPAAPRGANAAFPFCSSRCKLIDLGKWLKEEYRVPVMESPEDEESTSLAGDHAPQDQE